MDGDFIEDLVRIPVRRRDSGGRRGLPTRRSSKRIKRRFQRMPARPLSAPRCAWLASTFASSWAPENSLNGSVDRGRPVATGSDCQWARSRQAEVLAETAELFLQIEAAVDQRN
jgi:hypothetical protein